VILPRSLRNEVEQLGQTYDTSLPPVARIGMLSRFWEEGTLVVGSTTHVASGIAEIKGVGNQRTCAR